MATKVNTRFVLILTVTLFAAAGIVGGLWVLQIRSDTTRHIKAGDALMVRAEAATDSGDFDGGQALYEQALKQYGRAVTKDPAELSHLRKLETVLASMRPTTQSRAGELDAMRVEVLHHEVRYRRQDPEAHMKLITELYGLARQFDQTGAWTQVAEAADDMYDSMMSAEPMRRRAVLYRGMGHMRAYGLAGIGPISSTATTDEIDAAELDLQNYVDDFPEDDLAWAALAESKLAVARRLRADNRTREADEADIQAQEILVQALANVPDGPEVARVDAMRLALLGFEARQAVARLMPAVARSEFEVARLLSDELGLAVQPLTPEAAERLGVSADRGVLVANVMPGSAAAEAGLRPGDVILEVGTRSVNTPGAFWSALSGEKRDDGVRLAVQSRPAKRFVSLRSGGNGRPALRAADRALTRVVAELATAKAELEAAEAALAPIEAELDAAVDRMEQLAAASDDPLLLAEVTEIIRMTDYREGLPRSVDLLRAYADAHPDALYQRLQVAQLCYLARSHDPDYLREAYEAANVVINAEPVPVSTLSRIQNPLQIRAAGLIVDVEYRRWINAEEADKPAQLDAIVAAKMRLADFVAEPEKDVTYIRAEGKIAAARNDFRTAVDRFERALEIATTEDFETLWHAARCLATIGQDGKAWERIERAYRLRPTNIAVLAEKARLEYKVGRVDDALVSAQTVLAMDPTNVGAMRIVQAIATQESRGGRVPELGGTAGPLIQAREEAEGGDLDAACRTLVTAMENADDKLPFLSELIRLELSASRTEEAMAYLDQALEIEPNNQVLRRYKISLSAENQVEAVKQFVEEAYSNEADRAVHSVIQLQQLAGKLDENAERQTALGELETAEQASARADEARDEAEQSLVRAMELSPDHPSLIAHLFNATLLQLQDLADEQGAPDVGESAEQMRARLDAAREKAEQALVDLAERARVADADQTGGLIYRGRLELYQEDYERAVLTLTDATIRKSWSALAWRLLGQAHERLGNFTDALQAYEEAYSCNPNDKFAVRSYVSLLVQSGDQTRALRVLRNVQRSGARDDELREIELQLEANVGDLSVALDERRRIYEQDPEDRSNAMKLVALLARAKPSYQHVVTPEGQHKYGTTQWAMLKDTDRQEELDQVKTNWRDESDRIIRVRTSGGNSLEVAYLEAETHRFRGEIDEGEELLRAFGESHRDDPAVSLQALFVLGRYQASVNHFGAAADTYRAAREFQSEDKREADLALADLLFNQSNWKEAEKLYADLAGPDAGRNVLLRLAECYLKLERFEEASAALERAVAEGGPEFVTAMLSAGIADGHGDQLYELGRRDEANLKYAEASAALDEAERLQPRSPLPHVRRAQRLAGEFERTRKMTLLDDALLHLDRAERAAAGADSVSRARVEIFGLKGDVRGAVGELTRLLERTPGNVNARKLLVKIHAETGNWDRAMASIDEAITRNPTIPLWHEAKGDLLVLMSQQPNVTGRDPSAQMRLVAEAVTEFQGAFDLQPTGGRLAKYAETAMAGSAPDYGKVAGKVSASVELVEGRPVLRSLYARALTGVGRDDEAMEQMRAAYREHRTLLDSGRVGPAGLVNWLRALQVIMSGRGPVAYEEFVTELADGRLDSVEQLYVARVWVMSGPEGLSRGIELLQLALAQCPADDSALRVQLELDLGQFEVVADNIPAAVAAFERALEIDPENVLALNNAAYIYAEHLNDLDKALDYGERAVAVSPNEGTVLDTVGWTYYLVGRLQEGQDRIDNYQKAYEYLHSATQETPTPDNHLHLARVLFETTKDLDGEAARNRLKNTRTYLNRAAELRPSKDLQMEIDRLAEEIEAWANSAGQRLRR